MESPIDGTPGGKSYGWIWGVLAALVIVSFIRGCARAIREPQRQVVAAPVAPVDPEADYRAAFLSSFNASCLKKGNPMRFCNCAGPKVLENFKEEEIEGVVEAMKNGRPDVRMSSIIVQCSR